MLTRVLERLLSGAVLAATIGVGSAGAVTVFTDRDAFVTSFDRPLLTETFDTDIPTADSITFLSGIVSTKSSSGVPPTLNRVDEGDFDGFLVRDGVRTITFDLPAPTFGFGGDFGGAGTALSSLIVTAALEDGGVFTASISDQLGGGSGFFGLSSEQTFSNLTFSTQAGIPTGGIPIGGQVFSLDDVVLAPIPLPAGLGLLLGALGFGGAVSRIVRSRGRKALLAA